MRRLESGRRCEGGGGGEVAESDSGSEVSWYDRMDTSDAGWANVPVWRQDVWQGRERRGGSG